MKSLNEMFYDVILLNELGGNPKYATRFSNASSSSGLSFGVSQLDITHNDQAVACLKECGFTDDEIKGLQAKAVDWLSYSPRLFAHADIIEKYDTAQLASCLNKALNFETGYGIAVTNPEGVLALADAENQYGSLGDGTAAFMKALGHPVAAKDVLAWRLQTKYGREYPADCNRRINNVVKVVTDNA